MLLIQTSYAQTDTLTSKLNSKFDSLRNKNAIVDANQQLDSIQGQLTSRINHLTSLKLPDSIAGPEIGALRSQLDSIKGLVPNVNLQGAQQRLPGVQSAVNKRIGDAESGINDKLSVFNKNGGNLPGNVSIPKVDVNMAVGADFKMPDTQLPSLNASSASLPGVNVPGVSVPGINAPNLNVPNMDKIGEVSGKVHEYSGDLKNIKEGNLDKMPDVEKQLVKAGGLDAHADVLAQAQGMEKWKQDREYLKEMAFKKAKEQVVDHFAGHDKELIAAIEKLSAAKQKYAKVGGVVDMFKKPENPMKSKKFIERLQPGLSLQFQSATNQWFDLWPTIGYHWNHRFISGIGWNERVSYNFKKWQYVGSDRAYGPRAYTEFMLKSDFYVRAEAEWINAPVTSPYIVKQGDPPGRSWVWSYMAGVKKSFVVGGVVKGNVQTLYNIYNPLHRSPYNTRFIVRMGIEFPLNRPPRN